MTYVRYNMKTRRGKREHKLSGWLRPGLLQGSARGGVVGRVMAHTAERHRLDKLAADRHVEERPCELARPAGIAGEGAALGRGRGRGRKAREDERGLHLKDWKEWTGNKSDPQVNSNKNNKREATTGARYGC